MTEMAQRIIDAQEKEIEKLQSKVHYYEGREQFAKDPAERYEGAKDWKWLLNPLQRRLDEHVWEYENGISKLKRFSTEWNIKSIKREYERSGDFETFAGYDVGYAAALNRWLIESNPEYEGIYLHKRASKMDYKFAETAA